MSEQPDYAIHAAALRHLLKTLDEWEPRISRPRTKDDIGLAVQAWLDYPKGAGIIRGAKKAFQGEVLPVELRGATMVAKNRLDKFHTAAVDLLFRVARALGIDPKPLFVSSQVARRVYGADCGDCFTVDPRTVVKIWPDCLGSDISRLEQHEQDTIRESGPLLEELWRSVMADDGAGLTKVLPGLSQQDQDSTGDRYTKSGSAKLSPRELAGKHGVPQRALQARLERWRYDHDTGYVEVSNPVRNKPKYLYDESAVMLVIEALKAKPVAQKRVTNVQQKKV